MKQVALLRGINVGGNNKVPMAELRRLCLDLGWTGVTTYINSGNVVFESTALDHLRAAAALEDAIEAAFGFRCRVLVKSGDVVRTIAAAIPERWSNDDRMKCDVVYLLDGVDPHEVSASLAPRDGIDAVVHTDGALVWMVARQDAARSGLHRLIGTAAYQRATVRNANTARRLAAMVGAGPPG